MLIQYLGQLKAKLAKLKRELLTPSGGGGGGGGMCLHNLDELGGGLIYE